CILDDIADTKINYPVIARKLASSDLFYVITLPSASDHGFKLNDKVSFILLPKSQEFVNKLKRFNGSL
ncbi:MAG: hypothetical protein HZB65_03690, partial [Candidatus Aenigmarchaeota archaeon]|nr:hypothetical protein [Candidatus Aenigmarchaeota archaeon]